MIIPRLILGPAAGLAWGLLASAASAQAPPDDPPAHTPAQVLHKPSAEEIASLYPRRALWRGKPGRVVLKCVVGLSTRLDSCQVESEDPQGYGFGEAALKVAALMRVRPPEQRGKPAPDAVLRVPVSFKWTEEIRPPPAPSAAPAAKPSVPEPPPPRQSLGALWIALAFAAALLAGMPLALFWPQPGAHGRRRA